MLKVTLSSIWARKLRLALTAVAVIVSVAFMSGTYVLADTLTAQFDKIFTQVNAGKDVVVQPKPAFGKADDGTGTPLDAALVGTLAKVDGVAAVQGAINGMGQILDATGNPVDGAGPTIVSNSATDDQMDSSTYLTGRKPTAAGEVAIETATVKRLNEGVGGRMTLITPTGRHDLTIVGTFRFGRSGSGGALLTELSGPVAQEFFGRAGQWDEIDVRGADGVNAATLVGRVRAALPPTALAQTGKEAAAETAKSVGSFISVLRVVLTIFAGLALFIGAFIIVNTFSILVTQRTRELGLLRALGANRRQVLGSIVSEAFGVGLVGSVIGAAGGVVLAILLQLLLRAAFGGGGSIGVTVHPFSLLVPIVVGTAVTVLAGLYPGVRGSRVSPLAAMRDADVSSAEGLRNRALAGAIVTLGGSSLFGLGLVAKTALPAGLGAVLLFIGVALLLAVVARPLSGAMGAPLRLLGIASNLGVDNAQRNPRRTASTAAALMIGLALIGGVSTFASSLVASFTDIIEGSVKADLVIQPKGFGDGYPSTVTAQIAALPAAGRSTSIRFGEVQLADGSVKQVSAIDAAATDLIGMKRTDPDPKPVGTDEVLVSKTLAKDRQLAVGQSLPVTYARTGPGSVRIAGIYADNQLAGTIVLSLATYQSHFTSTQDGVALVSAKPGQLAALRTQIATVTATNPVVTAKTRQEFIQQQKDQVGILLRVVYGLLALSIIVAVIGIVNTLALSVFERTREIGLLRAVGMIRRQVTRMIRVEAVVVGVVGGIVGLAVGVLLGVTVVRSGVADGIDTVGIPVTQLVVGVVFAAVAGVVAAIYPAFKASRMNVLAAITVE